ncbi:MAG: ribbon-helix-helix domain-containing protein [Myxococcaceae bacterium]
MAVDPSAAPMMSDASSASDLLPTELSSVGIATEDAVSTHVLVDSHDVARLRALARRTRIAQSEYLREAVEDLLTKYGATSDEP